MANTTIYHYRIYPKERRNITRADFQLVKNYLFDEPYWKGDYQNGGLKSYSIPLVFEISTDMKFIEMLIEPYKNTDFLRNVDEVLELGKFDFWTIGMSDVDDINFIYLHSYPNEYSKSRNCKYKYDKIQIEINKKFEPSILSRDRIRFSNLEENIIELNGYGEYNSSICIGLNSNVMHCGYDEKRNLSDIDDMEIFDYGKQTESTGWFLDDNIFSIMKNLKNYSGIEKVEFFYKERRTRLYEKPDFAEGFMFDDWRNCADEEYEKYKKEKYYI